MPKPSSRRKKADLPPPPQPTLLTSGLSFAKEVCQHNMSVAVAFAFILFAATSAAAVLAIAYPELSQYSYNPVAIHKVAGSQVLGASTSTKASLLMRGQVQPVKEKSQPVVNNPSVAISVQPASYDQAADKWSYVVSWNRKLDGKTGSISINGVLVADNTTGKGQVTTDFIYSPDTKYRLNFYNQPALGGVRISSRNFTTLDTPDVSETGAAITPGQEDGNTPMSLLPPFDSASGTPMFASSTVPGRMHPKPLVLPPQQ